MSLDKLSRMPEDIISNILSLMPTKYAVRTSVLSKRWRYSWMYVSNLDFDNDIHPFHGKEIFTKFVDQVLTLCKTSQVKLFRLHLSKILVQQSSVSKWINEAIKLNVNALDIKVIKLGLPLSIFTCKTLTKLRIVSIVSNWEFLGQVDLPCLKTLDIGVYFISFVSLFKLISGCPMLESLSLEITKTSWQDKDGEDYLFNILTLKRLQLTWVNEAYPINKVVLNAPNLEYLFVGGTLSSVYVMKDVSSLVEADVSIYDARRDHLWVELLNGLSGVKSLSVQIPCSFFHYKTLFTSSLPIFKNMKHLELKGFWYYGLIPQFLESSPELKYLCIDKVVGLVVQVSKLKSEEYNWVEPKFIPACMLKHLTTIKFSICEGWTSDLPFLKYMLGNAKVLKTMAITWESLCVEEQVQLSAELLKCPRDSRCCEIHFH